jgi:hypothetical protein
LWWILWYIWYSCDFWVFLNVKNKKLQWSLCRASFGRRTAKWPKPTADTVPLPCVYRGTRQRCHLLPCISCPGARQRALFAVRFSRRRTAKSPLCRAFCSQVHGKEGYTPFGSGAVSCFCLPCVVRRGARQRRFTVQNATVLPLPCAPTKNALQRVCRAFLVLCRARFPVVWSGTIAIVRWPSPSDDILSRASLEGEIGLGACLCEAACCGRYPPTCDKD